MNVRSAGLLVLVLITACGSVRSAPRPQAPRPWLPPELQVRFDGRIGPSFRLERRRITLDGQVVHTEEVPATQPFEALVAAGRHEISVDLTLRGEGSGVFSYLRGYAFRVRSRRVVEAEPGRRLVVRVIAYERGGPTTPLEQRPAVRFEEQRVDR